MCTKCEDYKVVNTMDIADYFFKLKPLLEYFTNQHETVYEGTSPWLVAKAHHVWYSRLFLFSCIQHGQENQK